MKHVLFQEVQTGYWDCSLPVENFPLGKYVIYENWMHVCKAKNDKFHAKVYTFSLARHIVFFGPKKQ